MWSIPANPGSPHPVPYNWELIPCVSASIALHGVNGHKTAQLLQSVFPQTALWQFAAAGCPDADVQLYGQEPAALCQGPILFLPQYQEGLTSARSTS